MTLFNVISVFAILISALAPACLADKTMSLELCSTSYGPSSVSSVGTTTKALTLHHTQGCTVTDTPTSTVQPTPKTIVATTTVYISTTTTTLLSKVNTCTKIHTVRSTVSVTNAATSAASATVIVATITEPQSITTVPTSPGFTAASTNLNAGPPMKRRRWLVQPRNLMKRTFEGPTGFPETVTCGLLVDIIATNSKTVTATRTSTITAKASTTTRAVTASAILTSSICAAGASTSVTITTTLAPVTLSITTIVTMTSTASLTVTVDQPAATFYAACASDNQVTNVTNSVIGQNGNLLGGTVPFVEDQNGNLIPGAFTQLITDSAYDCCVACITNADCGGGFYLTDGSAQCIFANPSANPEGECDPSTNGGAFVYTGGDIGFDEPSSATAFNGYCGVVDQTNPPF